MGLKGVILPSVGILAAVSMAALYGRSITTKSAVPLAEASIDRLEEEIIIQGLKMESDVPMQDEGETSEGMIIYDEEFDDSARSARSAALKRPGGGDIKDGTSPKGEVSLINELRRKDRRWHVTRHRIRRGDSLWVIARRFGTDHRLVIKMNRIDTPDLLKPGMLISVPHRNGIEYTVKRGDTLTSIASAYRVPIGSIVEGNAIPGEKHILIPGARLFLPDAAIPSHGKKPYTGRESRRVIAHSSRIQLLWPLRGRITSSFGKRTDPFSRKRMFHCGIDVSAEPDTPVRASAGGTVIYSGWKDGYGNMVVLRHDKGYITVYAHNRENLVSDGDPVSRGDVIAKSGMSGAVTGAHLHFEVRKYLTPLNPLRMLR
jgi:murein DD-endopeptidase MepM/ murein hydrolase activator NlpD